MRNIWKWILFGAAFFVLAFLVALPLFGGLTAMPMRALGAGGISRGMMTGGGMLGGGLFGWLGLALRCIVPLIAAAGLVALVVVLVRKPAAPAAVTPPAPPIPTVPCPHCGQTVQEGWKACPFCGKKL